MCHEARLWYCVGVMLLGVSLTFTCRTAFGGFKPELVAIKADCTEVARGGIVWVTYTWRNAGDIPSENEYKILVHPRLQGAKEATYPMPGGDFWPVTPTTRWKPGALYTDGPLPLRILDQAPLGRYDVYVGMYLPGSGRIPLANQGLSMNGQRSKVFEITVVKGKDSPPGRSFEKTFADIPPVTGKPVRFLPPPAARDAVLENQLISVVVDEDRPRILSIEHKPFGARLHGGAVETNIEVEIYDIAAKAYRHLPGPKSKLESRSTVAPEKIRYTLSAFCEQEQAAQFDIVILLDTERIAVRLDNVKESEGFQLISVKFPDVVSTDNESAAIIFPWMRGRRVPLAAAGARRFRFGLNWDTPIVTAMLCDKGAIAILDTTDYDNEIETRIESISRGHYGALSCIFAHRIRASSPELQFVAQPQSEFSLYVVSDWDKNGRVTWIDGAKFLRSRITAKFSPMYRNATVYKISCDNPKWKKPTCTFPQALDLVRRIHNVTDGMKAHVYLVGWQYSGHDTGYPAVDKVNEELGGYDELVRIMNEASKYNATITFHDNYDDAYPDSPAWDESMIAIGSDGKIKKGGVWAGGQSYIIGMRKYVESGKALDRVRYTLAHYPLRGSYHIDVLSAVPRRHDHDPRCPAGANQNIAAKIRILQEFAKGGLDVTSEGFTACFVGHMSRFRHLRSKDTRIYWGEEYIPLIPFIYHGKIAYGNSASSHPGILLLDGANYSTDFSAGTPWNRITDLLYLIQIPWQLLAEREMTDYETDGVWRRVYYSSDTFVEMDRSKQRYTVQVDGRIIAKDFSTFAPIGSNRFAIYSKKGGIISFKLPPEWKGKSMMLFRMTSEGREGPVEFEDENGNFRMKAAPQQPYMLVLQ